MGANNARGVAILMRNNFDCVVEESVIDTNGRFVILKVLLSGEPTLIVNIYMALIETMNWLPFTFL